MEAAVVMLASECLDLLLPPRYLGLFFDE